MRANHTPILRRILPLLGIAFILAAGFFHRPIQALKTEHNMTLSGLTESPSPLVSFITVGLGGFRGILADILWVRASTLQEEGRYYELIQLSNAITQLEPQYASVWSFQSWNLAYNISSLFSDPRDRWRWVKSGIHLIRDEGLKHNPTSAELYRELSWLFMHKIGSNLESASPRYREYWFEEMAPLFQGAQPDYETLAKEYKLTEETMKELEATFGPLDWRSPLPHAIYWAHRGSQFAEGHDAIMLQRLKFQNLMALYFRSDPATPTTLKLPRLLSELDAVTIKHGHHMILSNVRTTFYKSLAQQAAEKNDSATAEQYFLQWKKIQSPDVGFESWRDWLAPKTSTT